MEMGESKRSGRSLTYSSAAQVLGVTAGLRVALIVRTVVVARLLLPEEFGKYALVVALVGLLETTTNSGFYEAIIKGDKTESESLKAAWTVVVIRGTVVTAILFVLANWVGAWFAEPDLSLLLRVIAVTPMIRSAASLGPVLAQRRVDYRWTARVTIAAQVIDLLVSILLVWILGSALGLALGAVAGALTGLATSYLSPGFAPGLIWRWVAVRPLLSFARWRWLSQIAWYAAAQGDDLIVGRVLGMPSLGVYRIAYTVGNLPTTETATALVQVTFPALARAESISRANVLRMYERYLTLTVGVAGLLATTILVLADPLVRTLLGEAWTAAIVPLGIISMGGLYRALAATGGALFLGIGKPAWDATMQSVRAVVLLLGLALLLRHGVVGAAAASALSAVAMLPIWAKGLASSGIPIISTLRIVGRRVPVLAVAGFSSWTISGWLQEPIYSVLVGGASAVTVWLSGTFLADPVLASELKVLIRKYRRPF